MLVFCSGNPAEVAQLVEQWSEESRTPRSAKLLGNSRLIPEIQARRAMVSAVISLEVRRAGRTHPAGCERRSDPESD